MPTPSVTAARTTAGPPSSRAILWTFVAGLVSTGIHYTHNFLYASDYPPAGPFVSDLAYQAGILLFWPTLTLWGAWGVYRYGQGRIRAALVPLAAWTMLGTTSPGHFLGGVPDIPAYAMFTISSDFATGVVMLVLVGQAAVALVRRTDVRATAA